jgi:predicted MFS family arabinose efflux permease
MNRLQTKFNIDCHSIKCTTPADPFYGTTAAAAGVAALRGGGNTKPSSSLLSTKRLSSLPMKQNTSPGKSDAKDDAMMLEQRRQQTMILLWIRLLFLSYYASLGSLMPYLPVYYDSLGHSGQIIGLLGAVKPFTTFVVAPIWGMISDSVADPFTILSLTYAVSLAGQLSVVFRSDASYITTMVFMTALFNAPVKSLLDSLVMEVLPPSMQGAAYGRLRLWGQLGFGLGSSAVGLLLSHSSSTTGSTVPLQAPRWWSTTNVLPTIVIPTFDFFDLLWRSATSYRILFLVHAALSIPTWICIQTFRRLNKKKKLLSNLDSSSIQSNKRSKKALDPTSKSVAETPRNSGVLQGLILLSRNTDALLFFFLVFVVGTSSGVIENFAYVRMREVGGTGKEMGLSRLVSSMAGAPMFWFSGPLTQALGADRVLILSLCSYVVRFIIYAAMRNPYHGLPAEALRGVTFAAFWSTSTIYAHRVSPPGLHATMLMFLNAMYGGLGQSLGSIIGGKLQQAYGTVNTFWYSAAFDAAFVVFVVLYLYCLKDNAASGFKDPKPIEASSPNLSKLKR